MKILENCKKKARHMFNLNAGALPPYQEPGVRGKKLPLCHLFVLTIVVSSEFFSIYHQHITSVIQRKQISYK